MCTAHKFYIYLPTTRFGFLITNEKKLGFQIPKADSDCNPWFLLLQCQALIDSNSSLFIQLVIQYKHALYNTGFVVRFNISKKFYTSYWFSLAWQVLKGVGKDGAYILELLPSQTILVIML